MSRCPLDSLDVSEIPPEAEPLEDAVADLMNISAAYFRRRVTKALGVAATAEFTRLLGRMSMADMLNAMPEPEDSDALLLLALRLATHEASGADDAEKSTILREIVS